MRAWRGIIALVAVAAIVSQVHAAAASAQEPNELTGLAAVQHDGYATLSWNAVPGATDYQIERTVVNPDGSLGTPAIVGVWLPERTITPAVPRFADAGFAQIGRAHV